MRKKLTFTVIVQSVTYSNDRIISHCMYHCLQSVALFCFVRTKVVRHFRTHDLRSNSNIPFSNAWCSHISACKKQKCLTWVKHECVEAPHIKKNQTRPTADGNDDDHIRWHTNRHNHITLLHTTITVVVAFNCFLLFSLFLSLLFFCAVLLLAFSKLCAPTTRNEWKQKYYGCFFLLFRISLSSFGWFSLYHGKPSFPEKYQFTWVSCLHSTQQHWIKASRSNCTVKQANEAHG